MTPMLRAALAYHDLGHRPVLLHDRRPDGSCSCWQGAACRVAGKHPRLGNWWQRAANAARNDVARWWSTYPTANIGLACGLGWFAVDIDPRNGGDKTWSRLVLDSGELPYTATALTGGMGNHVLFALPEASDVDEYALGRGIECLGAGHQIVVSPSVHPSGRRYQWLPEAHLANTPIASAPPWLARLVLRPKGERRTVGPATGKAAESFLARCFDVVDWLGAAMDDDRVMARCPWSHEHGLHDGQRTGLGQDSSCAICAPTDKLDLGRFRCQHDIHRRKTTAEVLAMLPAIALRLVTASMPREGGIALALLVRAAA